MHRRLLVAVAAIVVAWMSGTSDLAACGDKFLRIGRSPRYKGYAALHQAAILVYAPRDATPSALKKFEAMLKGAGHRATSVRDFDAFSSALSSAKYDMVIAILADAPRLREAASGVSPSPEVVPIIHKLTKTARADVERDYEHVFNSGASKFETLVEIDHVMEVRLNGSASSLAQSR